MYVWIFAASYDGNRFFTIQEGVRKVSWLDILPIRWLDKMPPFFVSVTGISLCVKLMGNWSLTGVKHFGQATPLLLTVAVIELSDIAFAVCSLLINIVVYNAHIKKNYLFL